MAARAIIAGEGALPGLILDRAPAHVVAFAGVDVSLSGAGRIAARFEQLGALFDTLADRDISEVCFAGAMTRPPLDPAALDEVTAALMPRLMAAMAKGDDALLRDIAAVFEERGIAVVGAHALCPDLVAEAGSLSGDPLPQADVARARAVLTRWGRSTWGRGRWPRGGRSWGSRRCRAPTRCWITSPAPRPAAAACW
jgi:DUF1009 family protein